MTPESCHCKPAAPAGTKQSIFQCSLSLGAACGLQAAVSIAACPERSEGTQSIFQCSVSLRVYPQRKRSSLWNDTFSCSIIASSPALFWAAKQSVPHAFPLADCFGSCTPSQQQELERSLMTQYHLFLQRLFSLLGQLTALFGVQHPLADAVRQRSDLQQFIVGQVLDGLI
jgi:hypothetical protein